MAKRRTKTRTHKKVSEEELAQIPRSMVLRLGLTLRNHSLTQLVRDFRNVMQPHTAINLRERKANKLKDFVVMAGPLGVSELFIFNQNEESGKVSMRIGKMPRGPNLQFQINLYSLAKDVKRILKHPKSVGKDSVHFLLPPLLVLNGFLVDSDNQHEKLLVTVLQNMFPPIQPQLTKVSGIKRVLMILKDPTTNEIEWRHYAIDTKLVDGNRNVKKLLNLHHNLAKSLPNLNKTQDVSDLLLDPYQVGGVTSDSEVEDDAIVEIKNENSTIRKRDVKPVAKSENSTNEAEIDNSNTTKKRAIKLTELGPRISMTLMKIEEGLVGSSKTLYHARVVKSSKEEKELNKKHEAAEQLRAQRRAEQKANVLAKQKKKQDKKDRRKKRQEGEASGEEGEDDSDDDDEEEETKNKKSLSNINVGEDDELDVEGYESELFSD